MARYKKCARCELNYILEDEDYCKVCKQEMKLEKGEDDEDLEICPICGVNYMPVNQVKCDECAKKKINDNDEAAIDDEDDSLNSAIDYNDSTIPNDNDIEIISLSELEEEEDDDDIDDSFDDDDDGLFGKAGDEEDDSEADDDDFDYVDPDDFSDEELEDDDTQDSDDDYDY